MRVGFYDPFLSSLGGGERYCLTLLAEAVRAGHEVTLVSPERPDPEAWARRLRIEVAPDAFAWVPGSDTQMRTLSRSLDLLVAMANDVPPLNHARRAVAMVQFPLRRLDRPLTRARNRLLRTLRLARAPAALASYDLFVCNSRFTRGHIARRLGVEAVVIAPPVDLPRAPAAGSRAKGRWIAAVGRFFTGWHAKRQDVLIEAFRALHGMPAAQGWELHLVGGAAGDRSTLAYLDRLRGAAQGLPVHFHLNAPADQVEDVLWRSPVFWHAAGHGVDPERHPERLEHFGIAAVEAMAHRAVPLVVPAGGPVEIVDDGRTGALWRDPQQLAELTAGLIADPPRCRAMAEAAAQRAAAFGSERFLTQAREHILHA